MSHPEGHALIIGTMGSGKTRCFDLLIFGRFCETVFIISWTSDRDLRGVSMTHWGSADS